MKTEPVWDVLVLGGGINGAGILRDLALRASLSGTPLKLALVDKGHFSSGTSGKNSQLIHGGLRYLKYAEFRLVREALHERATLRDLTPNFVRPLGMILPMYSLLDRLKFGAGLLLYDILAGSRNIARHRRLSPGEVSNLEPDLSTTGMVSAALFYDCAVHSARLTLANLWDASAHGACAVNYVRAAGITPAGDGCTVDLHDTLSNARFRLKARKVVDATGAWSTGDSLRLVRGSHIILPRLNHSPHAISHFDEQGRIIFFIPWGSEENLTLVGTTDVDHTSGPDAVRISPDEIRYLRSIVARIFPHAADWQPLAAYSSLRPLIRDESASATSTSREHRIWNSEDNVLHVAGGKYTTYRAMSEEAVDRILEEIAPAIASLHATTSTRLDEHTGDAIRKFEADAATLASRHGLQEKEIRWLIRDYGVHLPKVLALLPTVSPDGLTRRRTAQIEYALQHEMVQTLPDLLFVSTYWGHEQSWQQTALEPYTRLLGSRLGWDDDRHRREIASVLDATRLPEF